MMKKLEIAAKSGCVLFIVFCFVFCFSLLGIEISTGQKVLETIKSIVDTVEESVPSFNQAQTWINNGDNLLTLLGTLVGLLMSGGFWTWRKGAAFQRGFANGWNQRSAIAVANEPEFTTDPPHITDVKVTELQQKYDSLLYDHTNNLMLLGIATKDIQVLQERDIANQELKRQWTRENDQLKVVHADQQQRIAHLSKNLDEKSQFIDWGNERIKELQTKIKQAEENHLQSYGPAKEAGKEEGRQELAAKIVEHLLATEQDSYVLNQKTGAVTLTMKQVGQLSPVLSNLIIALSGCMTPKKPQLNAIFPTAVLSLSSGSILDGHSGQQYDTPPKETEKKAELCIYCKKEPVNDGFVLEYRGLCDDCGNRPGMDLKRLFTSVTNCNWTEWQAFLDMPIGVFIDKFGPLKGSNNQPLNSKREDGKITWRADYTVRDYIQSYGMFKKG